MRLFIAIDLPEEAKSELRKAQNQLPEGKEANLSKPKDFHITLKFLGEATPQKAEWVKEKLRQVKFPGSRTTLSSLGVFPNENRIRVVWAGISPEEEAAKLQKEIDVLIGKEFPDDYRFSSHITLARVKYASDKKQFLQQLKRIRIEPVKFAVDSFKLKKSTLTKEGAVYDDLEVYSPQ
ncbi:RNA 2',3'-cyclic phosphodiesterase [Candidatus Woesearchaeota archaeon]|nr:RNA 2',3'-cyclic phosphodiesterase [Candidatus Woesearchaeota archaeon]